MTEPGSLPAVRPDASTLARRRRLLVIASVAGMGVVAAVVLAIGQLPVGPAPSATAEPTVEPGPIGACDDVTPPSGGNDIVVVRFPCGPSTELARGVRPVPFDRSAVDRLEVAVRAVLDGPTELERSLGFAPIVPPGSSDLVTDVALSEDGLATIGFSGDLLRINNLSASAASGAFLSALRETAFQFDEVAAIRFTAAGSCDRFFAFFQMACQIIARPVEGPGAELEPVGAIVATVIARSGEALTVSLEDR